MDIIDYAIIGSIILIIVLCINSYIQDKPERDRQQRELWARKEKESLRGEVIGWRCGYCGKKVYDKLYDDCPGCGRERNWGDHNYDSPIYESEVPGGCFWRQY